ncbi:DUF3085 domain-containing protein [Vibrio owensii]
MAKIFLVHNQGIYCMTSNNNSTTLRPSLVYALGCNPNVDDDWQLVSRELAGGDDFSYSIPPEWIETAIVNQRDYFDINIGVEEIELIG